MEWGFVIALIGVAIILLSTIWYFASYLNQLRAIMATTTSVKAPDGKSVQHVDCSGNNVDATGATITLAEAWKITTTPVISIAGWVLGAVMVIGGGIWGLVQRGKSNPESRVNALLAALSTQPKSAVVAPVVPAPVVAAPVVASPAAALTPEQLRALREEIVRELRTTG